MIYQFSEFQNYLKNNENHILYNKRYSIDRNKNKFSIFSRIAPVFENRYMQENKLFINFGNL